MMPPDSIGQNEPRLSVRLQSPGDFEALYRRYWRPLYEYAYVKTHDGDVAEEIVQDLFVTLWEKRDSLAIGNLQHYLFAAVRNRVITHYKRAVFAELDSVADPAAPEYATFLDELETALHEAVAQLPDKTREIFVLNRFESQTIQQIARQLRLPERTVEYHITQALRRLKTLLRDYFALLPSLFKMAFLEELIQQSGWFL